MIRTDLTNADYHARDEISKSGLDLIAKSPAHFRIGWRGIGSDAARVGTALHAVVLERGAGLVTMPNVSKRSKADRARWSEWFEEHGADPDIVELPAAAWLGRFEETTGLTAVSEEERDTLGQMSHSILANPIAGPLLDAEGVAEASIITELHGVPFRARPDWISEAGAVPTLIDVKTTIDASKHEFRRSAARYRYGVQDAAYSAAYQVEKGIAPRFLFVVVEKSPPFPCAVYGLDMDAIAHGEYLLERDLATYRRCLESDTWPSYPDDLELDLPVYDPAPEIAITVNGEAA